MDYLWRERERERERERDFQIATCVDANNGLGMEQRCANNGPHYEIILILNYGSQKF